MKAIATATSSCPCVSEIRTFCGQNSAAAIPIFLKFQPRIFAPKSARLQRAAVFQRGFFTALGSLEEPVPAKREIVFDAQSETYSLPRGLGNLLIVCVLFIHNPI
jgi:hypothetical protein